MFKLTNRMHIFSKVIIALYLIADLFFIPINEKAITRLPTFCDRFWVAALTNWIWVFKVSIPTYLHLYDNVTDIDVNAIKNDILSHRYNCFH